MAVWVIRAGRMGENEEFALNEGVYCIGFNQEQSVTDFKEYTSLRDHIQRRSDDLSLQQVASQASQLWRFVRDMKVGDMVVLPRRQPRVIAVGKVVGDYIYDVSRTKAPLPHTRKIEWIVQDVPRANFDSDLLRSINSNRTVFKVSRNNAEGRINGVVNAYLGNEQIEPEVDVPVPNPTTVELPDEYDDAPVLDLEQEIRDRIIGRIRQRYREHDLETLVDEILKADGYVTLKTKAGRDGGADILAGSGALGFDSPKLCVQVKSSAQNVGIADYDRLQGTLDTFNADYGLLVSSAGFTQDVIREDRRRFFKIRLWGPDDLVQKLLDTYDRLPQSIRTNIPLENRLVWMGQED